MPSWWCEGSTRRFDSVPYSVCPAQRTNTQGIVKGYYHVLVFMRWRGWARGTRPSPCGTDSAARESVWDTGKSESKGSDESVQLAFSVHAVFLVHELRGGLVLTRLGS